MKKNFDKQNLNERVSENHSFYDDNNGAESNLIENEKFVKKLEIQINIIKKIIEPETEMVPFDNKDQPGSHEDL